MKRMLLLSLLIVGCTKSTLPQYYVIDGLRVLALEIDKPEVAPGTSVTLTAVVSDYTGAGRALTYSVVACADPGIGFGAEVTCDGRPDRAAITENAALTGLAAPNYTGTAPTTSFTVPATVLDGRSATDQFNGVAYLVFFTARAADGTSVVSVKRVIVSNNPTKNSNPTVDKILADGADLTLLPTRAVKLRASIPAGATESFSRIAPDGSTTTDTESLVVSWFVTAGPLSKQKTGVAQDTEWEPPGPDPAGQNRLVVVVVRDQRGGEAHFIATL